ncbi:hypothetical protein Legendre_0014, partial [Mycobacterium phage Legendre]
PDQSAE